MITKDLDIHSHLFKKRGRGRPKKNAVIEPIIEDDLDEEIEEGVDAELTPRLFDKEIVSIDADDPEAAEVIVVVKKVLEKPDKKKYYVDTARLTQLIVQYYNDDNIGDELALALYNIAHRISFMPNFINYSWREEMIGDGIVKEFTALKNKKFDPAKGKAFSYFSMIVYNAFCNRIKKENKEHAALENFREESYDCLITNMAVKTNERGDDDEND